MRPCSSIPKQQRTSKVDNLEMDVVQIKQDESKTQSKQKKKLSEMEEIARHADSIPFLSEWAKGGNNTIQGGKRRVGSMIYAANIRFKQT